MQQYIPRSNIVRFASMWLILMCVSAWVLNWNVVQDVNNLFFDRLSTGAQRNDIVIIGIDDASLKKIGAWPWNRNVHANLITKLGEYNPRGVAFDVLFLEPREGDIVMQQVLDNATYPIVLGSKFETSGYIHSVYALHNSRVTDGVVNVTPDSDSKVRSVQPFFTEKEKCIPSLAYALIPKTSSVYRECSAIQQVSLRYQEKIPRVSYVDVLNGTVALEQLKDKFILIGYATTDLEVDSFSGLLGTKINGVEIHAHALATALNNTKIFTFSKVAVLLINLLIALLLALLPSVFKRASLQLALLASVCFVVIFGAVFAYEYGYKTYIPWAIGLPIISYTFALLYSYIVGAQRNEYLKKVFGTYVHPSLLEELIADPKKLKLGGEKRHMTVLFSDVRGFTTFSEKLSPEGLVDLLNGYLNVMSPIILERRGTIDKYIGDAIMAFWNAPVQTLNHELLAVEAALEMQEKLAVFNTSLNRADGLKLGIGIGVNSGDMVVGNMGSDQRFNYTVMGDAVNTGSRFEGLTKKYGIITIVGESTRKAITDTKILFRKLDIMTVKGKSDPTTIYEPLRASDSMKEFVEKYELGFDAYVKADFTTAKKYLEPLATHGDEPSKMIVERMKTIDVDSWKGVWKWDEK